MKAHGLAVKCQKSGFVITEAAKAVGFKEPLVVVRLHLPSLS